MGRQTIARSVLVSNQLSYNPLTSIHIHPHSLVSVCVYFKNRLAKTKAPPATKLSMRPIFFTVSMHLFIAIKMLLKTRECYRLKKV